MAGLLSVCRRRITQMDSVCPLSTKTRMRVPVGWGPPPFLYTPYVAMGSSYLSLSLCDWFLRYTFLLLPSCVSVVQRLGQTALVFVRRSGVKAAFMKQVSEASPADPQVVLVWEKVDSPKSPCWAVMLLCQLDVLELVGGKTGFLPPRAPSRANRGFGRWD